MSDDAIITDAQIPINESAPYSEMIVSKVAREALPENGRKRIKEKRAEGIPSLLKAGERNLLNAFSAPEETNIETETISAHIEGRSATELLIPFLAPLKKLEK